MEAIGDSPNGLGVVSYLACALNNYLLWNYYNNSAETNYLSYLPASLRTYGRATGKWVEMNDQYDI